MSNEPKYRPVNAALGMQPRLGPLPADQVIPWMLIAFVFLHRLPASFTSELAVDRDFDHLGLCNLVATHRLAGVPLSGQVYWHSDLDEGADVISLPPAAHRGDEPAETED